MTRLTFAPLTDWPYPPVPIIGAPFRAKWTDTRALLLAELDHVVAVNRGGFSGAVLELDLAAGNLRQDGEIRANARPHTGRVRLSFTNRDGMPLQFACDRYDGNYQGLLSWQANARAIALTLQALRAVDRYGAVRAGEQYTGFRALSAGGDQPRAPFASADAALRWIRDLADTPDDVPPAAAYKRAARAVHPDTGSDPDQWATLDQARQLLSTAGVL